MAEPDYVIILISVLLAAIIIFLSYIVDDKINKIFDKYYKKYIKQKK